MAASTAASPRGRSIRETVLESVAAYHHQQRMRRKFRKSLSYAGELSSAGRGGGNGPSPSASSVSLSAGPEEDDEPFWEEEEGTVELVQLGANRAKNVLILMSDTGGGHRASAEAIKDAFRIEFGDDYRVNSRIPPLRELSEFPICRFKWPAAL
jgi:1,2-diacylglycerol 3-beta-galactosyltransferase